jgi:hypoxanthine-DNA glycosylase
MSHIIGFKPIADCNAKILILGSMPGEVSLQKMQYYGHTRNSFWSIILTLLGETADLDIITYKQRKDILIKNQIAVWDVLQSCFRSGSLDTAIKMNSIKVNDFNKLFSNYTTIKKVYFNGAKAEAIYTKHVLPHIEEQFKYLKYVRLPSTSPAHASMTLEQKTLAWRNEINLNREQ